MATLNSKVKFVISDSLGFPWCGYSPPKVSSKLGSLLQSYSIEKHMATLTSKKSNLIAICLFMARRITTQSFVQIGLNIAELQH